eukprot:m51a1_g3393 hypothetical protein (195) ;mRNA; f:519620-520392
MLLSEEAIKGLLAFAQGELANEAVFKALLEATLEIILGRRAPDSLLSVRELSGLDRIAVKQGHSALCSLLLEAAKDNDEPQAVAGALEENNVPAGIRALASARYEAALPALRASLARIGSKAVPRIVGVNWRLDYVVRSDAIDHACAPLYFVRLRTSGQDGEDGTVEFSCSIDDLQDLVSKLRDATKQIERSAS